MSDRLLITSRAVPAKASRKELTPTQALIGNILMFVITGFAAYFVVTGAKGLFGGAPAGGYVLTTTEALEPGEKLTSQNAVWKPVTGRAPSGVIVSTVKDAAIDGYVAVSRISPGKPVRESVVIKPDRQALKANVALSGYILPQDDLGDAVKYLQIGDHVNIIAIIDPSKDEGATHRKAAVGTVIKGAEVIGVTRPQMGARAARQTASAVIGVTEDQARLLSAVRRFASLEVVLSAASDQAAHGSPPMTDWAGVDRLGIPTFGDKPAAAPQAIDESDGGEAAPPPPPAPSITVITPGAASSPTPN
jgi:hypothetical protein